MTVDLFLNFEGDTVVVRLPSPPGSRVHADFVEDVAPGGSFCGIPYANLKAMGEGAHSVEVPDPPPAPR